MSIFKIKFWGVCGSVASPKNDSFWKENTAAAIEEYVAAGYPRDVHDFVRRRPVEIHGGNTSCVELLYLGNGHLKTRRFVLDTGTGAFPMGRSLMPEMFDSGGLFITYMFSHEHWDHLQGWPFLAPIFWNRRTGIVNSWEVYGGNAWQATAEECLRGQMDPPLFPVSSKEIDAIGGPIRFEPVCDMMSFAPKDTVDLSVYFRKLDHPQETYGMRFESVGKRVVYATDNEPRDPRYPNLGLLDLAERADVLVIDCQYSGDQYNGIVDGRRGKFDRHGWGHSYPYAVAEVCVQAHVQHVILFHHDPASTPEDIRNREKETRDYIKVLGGDTTVMAAYEGLVLEI